MIASTAFRSRTISAPMPLGAPILWPEMVSERAGASSRGSIGSLPNAWTASVWKATPASRQRPAISATGCTTPTSLFTHITDTTAGPLAQRLVERVEVDPAVAVDRKDHLAPAEVADGVRRRQDRLVLDGRDDGTHGAAALPGRERGADDAEVVGLGAAGGEDHLVGLGADRLGHLAPGLLEAGARGPAEPVGARRVAEGLGRQVGQHRLQHLGADRGGGGVVEVDGRVGHEGKVSRPAVLR